MQAIDIRKDFPVSLLDDGFFHALLGNLNIGKKRLCKLEAAQWAHTAAIYAVRGKLCPIRFRGWMANDSDEVGRDGRNAN